MLSVVEKLEKLKNSFQKWLKNWQTFWHVALSNLKNCHKFSTLARLMAR